MQTLLFRRWLESHYLQANGKPLADGTRVSRIANCSTIEQVEGDLDLHFARDGMTKLLNLLSYSSADQAAGAEPKHHISIHGDAVNGSSTYRSAANLYRKFRVAQENGFWVRPDRMGTSADLVTEKKSLTKVRLGQQRFRYQILERWDYRCAVTKAGILLTASHIKPWKVCSSRERLDACNGICLSPLFDRAFDCGVITFGFDGELVLSPTVSLVDARRLGLDPRLRLDGLGRLHHTYLEHHHKYVWRNEGASFGGPP